jgi:hypothetical protein
MDVRTRRCVAKSRECPVMSAPKFPKLLIRLAMVGLGVKKADTCGHRAGRGARLGRGESFGDEMNVVRHEAVAQQGYAVDGAFFAEGVEVEAAVCFRREYVLAVVAALGHVVGDAFGNDAGFSGHCR